MEKEIGKNEALASLENSSSSDNESWTILDEEDSDHTLSARVDVVQNLAEFSKSKNLPESDSDIETIDEQEQNLESLQSDGIPVGNEVEIGKQYLWSNEVEAEEDLEIIKGKFLKNYICFWF